MACAPLIDPLGLRGFDAPCCRSRTNLRSISATMPSTVTRIGPAAFSAAHNGPLLRDPILLDQLAEPECVSFTRHRLEEVRNRKLGHLLTDHMRMLVRRPGVDAAPDTGVAHLL